MMDPPRGSLHTSESRARAMMDPPRDHYTQARAEHGR